MTENVGAKRNWRRPLTILMTLGILLGASNLLLVIALPCRGEVASFLRRREGLQADMIALLFVVGGVPPLQLELTLQVMRSVARAKTKK